MAMHLRAILAGGLGTLLLAGCGTPLAANLASSPQRYQLQPSSELASPSQASGMSMGRMMSGRTSEASGGMHPGGMGPESSMPAEMKQACQEHHPQP